MTIDYSSLPPSIRDSVKSYVEDGDHPGSFLTAVLSNDLRAAIDRGNTDAIHACVLFLNNHAPAWCYGTPDRVNRWISLGGLHGDADREVA